MTVQIGTNFDEKYVEFPPHQPKQIELNDTSLGWFEGGFQTGDPHFDAGNMTSFSPELIDWVAETW